MKFARAATANLDLFSALFDIQSLVVHSSVWNFLGFKEKTIFDLTSMASDGQSFQW